MQALDSDALNTYLIATDAELKLFIDPAHMNYLPHYLGRADARHALGQPVDLVLRELAFAARCYAAHGGIFLAKWPPLQFRRRRLEPLEIFLAARDEDAQKGIREHFAIDAFSFLAGLENDELQQEVAVVTPFFQGDTCETPAQAAGALGIFYWFALSAAIREDAEALAFVRQRAGTFADDYGHLLGGASAGPVARLRTIQECLQVLRNPLPTKAAEIVARTVTRHTQLSAAEFAQLATRDPDAWRLQRGGLDRTALALLSLTANFGIDAGPALNDAGISPRWLEYARALGHTVAS